MLKITVNNIPLDLPDGFSMEIEDTNPILNDRGSQSLPATVPVSKGNIRAIGTPHRLDSGSDVHVDAPRAKVVAGAYQRKGVLNVTEASRTEGITFNIGFDNSTAYSAWQSRKLSDLKGLPTYTPRGGANVEGVLDYLFGIYKGADSQITPLAVFPIAVASDTVDNLTYWELLNVSDGSSLAQYGNVNRVIDGTVTSVNVPEGYSVTPFLRVWTILELIFNDLGTHMQVNPFKADIELSRVVVLNNTADAVCRGSIRYADLMPDCTVQEFLHSLWVRFGLVYNVNFDAGTATLALIKDIVTAKPVKALDKFMSSWPKITYNPRQYVKLSAKTSLEGAAPANDRFEDFVKGLNLTGLRQGSDVGQWQNVGTATAPVWDGNADEDYFDPWADYDPTRDDREIEPIEPEDPEPYAMRAPRMQQPAPSVSTIAREFLTGQWFRLDAANSNVQSKSSPFFNWDPQPEGHEALDLSSVDECVPIGKVATGSTAVGLSFDGYCPIYLCGAKHYHTFVSGSQSDSHDQKTPLAFVIAYTLEDKTIGRICPESATGAPIILRDGSQPKLSLLFQFRDGLFARYWKEYDEILRHANRTVEVEAVFDPVQLNGLDMFSVHTLQGVRGLINSVSYSLPKAQFVATNLKLLTIQPQGSYNIQEEQNIPDFAVSSKHLEWRLLKESFGQELDTNETRQTAINDYLRTSGYTPHGTDGDYWYIGQGSAVLQRIERTGMEWQIDPNIEPPANINQKKILSYRAAIYYGIHELNDTGTQENPHVEIVSETLSVVRVNVDYSVTIVPHWVAD